MFIIFQNAIYITPALCNTFIIKIDLQKSLQCESFYVMKKHMILFSYHISRSWKICQPIKANQITITNASTFPTLIKKRMNHLNVINVLFVVKHSTGY